jgi:hypothetical protein
MKQFILFCFLTQSLALSAQFHDYNTIIGYYGGWITPPGDKFGISHLTFPDGSLHIEENYDLVMYFDGTNASFSDSIGQLQLYSNGIWTGNAVWDSLENGDNLTDDGPLTNIWPQMALALPKPGAANHVMLFYGDEALYWPFGTNNELWICSQNLYIAEIDMNLNNGLGGVVARGQVVVDDTLSIGKFTACKHANGRDWWILAHEYNTNRYYRVLLDPSGAHLVGVQAIGSACPDGVGQACFAPNGEKYVVIDGIDFDTATTIGNLINIYDFDRCTGLLSNHIQINEPIGAWVGGAISFDSRYFYAGVSIFAKQYDLYADDIEASAVKIMQYDGYLSPFRTESMFHQLMPDGKIYVCTSSRSNVLHVIHHPDEQGLGSSYEQHAIHLPTYNAFSLPNFPFFRLGSMDGSSCDTLGLSNYPRAWWRYDQDTLDILSVVFRDLSYYEPATWTWNFGDTASGVWNTSTERHPKHIFSQPDKYEVCLTVTNANGTDTHCKTLYLGVSAQDNPVLQNQIEVTPNPFSHRLSVALSGHLRSPVLYLYDLTGRLVREQALNYGISEINTAELAKGMYFWQVVSAGEVVKVGKAVKI